MLAEYKKKTNVGVGFGILASIVGSFLVGGGVDTQEAVLVVLGGLLLLGGTVLFIWGCCSYAKGKGHSGAW